MTTVYLIDGSQVGSLEDFYRVIGEAVNEPSGYFGRNLDALDDCLAGGFGTPEDSHFVIEWRDHLISSQRRRKSRARPSRMIWAFVRRRQGPGTLHLHAQCPSIL